MAGYAPPVGQVTLTLKRGLAPLTGAVELVLGPDGAVVTDRHLAVSGNLPGLSGAARIRRTARVAAVGTLGGLTGAATLAYDPNLLSAAHRVAAERWAAGRTAGGGIVERWSASRPATVVTAPRWSAATRAWADLAIRWQQSAGRAGEGIDAWRDAAALLQNARSVWRDTLRAARDGADAWREANGLRRDARAVWAMTLPRLNPTLTERWRQGDTATREAFERFADGARRVGDGFERWRQAGYPANAGRVGPPLPPPGGYAPPVGLVALHLCRRGGLHAGGPVALELGPRRCPGFAWIVVPARRTYHVLNSASLIRLPDLVPLPCDSLVIETDAGSWCWALTATLKTPAAWPLVQPGPLAREVRATINGHSWDFLLDVPSQTRSFNSDQVSAKGRSRSAWLDAPYTPPRNLGQAQARELRQLADAALDNTGWALDWRLENWVVPGGRYSAHDTPIGALLALAAATGDGVYSHPTDRVVTLYKRWPAASWLLDAAVTDIQIPEDALRSLSRTPLYSQPINGVYVSGTTHGALALVKIAGTDGALQPPEPIAHDLLCDPAGVAARQRGLNALSDAGAGDTLDAELLLLPELGVIRPGQVVTVAGIKGVSRKTRVSAEWGGDGLRVTYSVGLERREVEA